MDQHPVPNPQAVPETHSPERILFLYVAPVGGHKRCADAMRKAFKSREPAVQTFGLDAITSFYPILGQLIAKTYMEILRHTPQIWSFLYDNPEIEGITRELRQLFNFFNASNLASLLETYHPTALVCTHAVTCGVIAEQKKRGNCELPLVAVITDFAVHAYWIHPQVDLYIVPNEAARNRLAAHGIPQQKIRTCGIPVDPSFARKLPQAEARQALGLSPHRFTVLIMGGSKGFGPIQEITHDILGSRLPVQVLIVAGKNKELEKKLAVFKRCKQVRVWGHTDAVGTLMDAADLIATKPGGITAAEALAKELPMILFDPIPGQEARNARFLVQHGAAVKATNLSPAAKIVRHLHGHPNRLRQLSERARSIAAPHAAADAARAVLELLSFMRARAPSATAVNYDLA